MAWNRPNNDISSRSGHSHNSPRTRVTFRWTIASLAMAILISAGVYFALHNEAPHLKNDSVSVKEQKLSVVEVEKPIAAKQTKEMDPKDDYDHTQFYRDDKGILRYMSGCRAPDPTRKARKVNLAAREKPSVFSNSADRAIFQLIRRKPGRMSFARHDWYAKEFEEEFRQSLLEPIRISDNDTPRERYAKQAMIEARSEIQKRMAAGESLGDILSAAEKETKRLREYKRSLEKQVGDIVESAEGKLSSTDVKDLVTAANEMFAKEGLAPIKEDAFIKWNLQLSGKENDDDAEVK